MVTFQVNDMTCGHCASVIARAISGVDRAARMDIRIHEKRVRVSSTASAAELAEAIQDAGYSPRQLPGLDAPSAPAAQPAGCGSACGCASRA